MMRDRPGIIKSILPIWIKESCAGMEKHIHQGRDRTAGKGSMLTDFKIQLVDHNESVTSPHSATLQRRLSKMNDVPVCYFMTMVLCIKASAD